MIEDENGESAEKAREPEKGPDRTETAPIDEDVTGQVNAAVPPGDEQAA